MNQQHKYHQDHQQGQAALITVIVIMSVALAVAFSLSLVSFFTQRIARNVIKSAQSYYAAESGVEDALLRLVQLRNLPSSYSFDVDGATTDVTISAPIGQVWTLTGIGDAAGRFRKVQVTYAPNETDASFFYGLQVGDGGLTMDNNSQVVGNVFSNGTVSGSGEITESVVVAGNGNKIDGMTVGQDADVHTCEDSTIGGTLTYVSGGSVVRCTAGTTVDGGPNEIEPLPFPITQDMIDGWKNHAVTGGTLNGDVTVTSSTTLGPVKIDGNLTLDNNVIVTLTGTVWVTGTFTPGNNSQIILDESTYDTMSGVMVFDGNVKVQNNVGLSGTSAPTSYLLLISTSPSVDMDNPAIDVVNNVGGSILFTPNGLMRIRNNVELVEATAYQLHLDNNAVVTYEVGLQDLTFSSGPSGGSGVVRWREVQ